MKKDQPITECPLCGAAFTLGIKHDKKQGIILIKKCSRDAKSHYISNEIITEEESKKYEKI